MQTHQPWIIAIVFWLSAQTELQSVLRFGEQLAMASILLKVENDRSIFSHAGRHVARPIQAKTWIGNKFFSGWLEFCQRKSQTEKQSAVVHASHGNAMETPRGAALNPGYLIQTQIQIEKLSEDKPLPLPWLKGQNLRPEGVAISVERSKQGVNPFLTTVKKS